MQDEWLQAASNAYCKAMIAAHKQDPTKRSTFSAECMAAALAAVIPLIQKEEREACAKVAETHEWFVGGIGTKAPGSGESRAIATAIRARGEL